MFIIINNKSFKSTELRLSPKPFRLSNENLKKFAYVYHHIHYMRDVKDDETLLKVFDLLLDKKLISVEELERNDSRVKSFYETLCNSKKTDVMKYNVSSTEFMFYCLSKVYLIKHPEGNPWFFYFWDKESFEISKLYDSEEECREAWERLMSHCNKIVFELPKEYV